MKNAIPVLIGLLVPVVSMHASADDIGDARATAVALAQQLGAALKKELAANGADGAISVCRDLAPAIAGEMSRKSGDRIARVSLKVRNPLLGTPDAWEQRVLMEFDQRAASGEKPEILEYSETTSEPAGRFFRYMKALPVQPMCLSCHGPSDSISESVKARLAAEYPRDHATGYVAGEVRGAVTIKRFIGGTP